MPIFWTPKPHAMHCLLPSALGLLIALVPVSVLSLEISTPVGVQQIGRHLDLKSTLSNVPEGVESQLRSTCLRATMHSLESSSVSHGSALSNEVLVNFDPTIRQGGLLEFKSVVPVHDTLIEMKLVSECPLIVFSTKWTFIMKQAEVQAKDSFQSKSTKSSLVFDPEGSELLASSRKPPTPQLDEHPAWFKQEKEGNATSSKEEPEHTNTELSEQGTGAGSSGDALKVASLDTNLFGAGLIESRRDAANAWSGLGLDEYPVETSPAAMTPDLMLPVSLAGLFSLILAWFAYRRYSIKKKVTASNQIEPNDAGFVHSDAGRHDIGSISREHAMAFAAEPAASALGSHLVLESLIGNDEQDFDEEMNALGNPVNSDLMDSSNRSSLKISLELINRADIPGWKLPASYSGLVEARNRSLELHRTLDALLLRSQIGLIELAFQDAKQGQLTAEQTTLELLEQVMGDQLHEIDSKPTLCVPDVVKSHVRAKMCEVVGAEKRQLLRENLLNLNRQVVSPAVCFSSNAWREFLSEEGILD
jgi:hypothetical protein